VSCVRGGIVGAGDGGDSDSDAIASPHAQAIFAPNTAARLCIELLVGLGAPDAPLSPDRDGC